MEQLLIALVGLCIGSLLNIIIIRLPRERRLLGWPRCTRTGEPLAWWQLLPVLGWLGQAGRARNGKPLHWIYPLVEILTAVVLLRLHALYGFNPSFFYLSFVCMVLIVTGAIDWLHKFIYTFIILGAALLALVWGWFVGMNTIDVVSGALIAGFAFVLLYMLAKVLFPGNVVPFGMGDVYLAIFIGAAIGFNHLMPSLFYGMLMAGLVSAGILIARKIRKEKIVQVISYGSYLCLGVVCYVTLWGI
ncbi:MAG: prepilin peptidase [Chloroflexaceae bacterium]|jgi:leader peptidase (prepilin peptidase)/N-methyltransferase|nr:prepilin peptidase [Chloroflexaceae bacterium]